jgi:hypothetical protein|tara:strand:+ start:202 stop:471 length:270 start_codon:yes stop_codon:yes gene_type:complete
MPYIEKTGKKTINEQLYQWYHVMVDPRIDGFNGFACKQKIYEVKMECERILNQDNCPTYAGEEEWLKEKLEEIAMARISGDREGVPYVS